MGLRLESRTGQILQLVTNRLTTHQAQLEEFKGQIQPGHQVDANELREILVPYQQSSFAKEGLEGIQNSLSTVAELLPHLSDSAQEKLQDQQLVSLTEFTAIIRGDIDHHYPTATESLATTLLEDFENNPGGFDIEDFISQLSDTSAREEQEENEQKRLALTNALDSIDEALEAAANNGFSIELSPSKEQSTLQITQATPPEAQTPQSTEKPSYVPSPLLTSVQLILQTDEAGRFKHSNITEVAKLILEDDNPSEEHLRKAKATATTAKSRLVNSILTRPNYQYRSKLQNILDDDYISQQSEAWQPTLLQIREQFGHLTKSEFHFGVINRFSLHPPQGWDSVSRISQETNIPDHQIENYLLQESAYTQGKHFRQSSAGFEISPETTEALSVVFLEEGLDVEFTPQTDNNAANAILMHVHIGQDGTLTFKDTPTMQQLILDTNLNQTPTQAQRVLENSRFKFVEWLKEVSEGNLPQTIGNTLTNQVIQQKASTRSPNNPQPWFDTLNYIKLHYSDLTIDDFVKNTISPRTRITDQSPTSNLSDSENDDSPDFDHEQFIEPLPDPEPQEFNLLNPHSADIISLCLVVNPDGGFAFRTIRDMAERLTDSSTNIKQAVDFISNSKHSFTTHLKDLVVQSGAISVIDILSDDLINQQEQEWQPVLREIQSRFANGTIYDVIEGLVNNSHIRRSDPVFHPIPGSINPDIIRQHLCPIVHYNESVYPDQPPTLTNRGLSIVNSADNHRPKQKNGRRTTKFEAKLADYVNVRAKRQLEIFNLEYRLKSFVPQALVAEFHWIAFIQNKTPEINNFLSSRDLDTTVHQVLAEITGQPISNSDQAFHVLQGLRVLNANARDNSEISADDSAKAKQNNLNFLRLTTHQSLSSYDRKRIARILNDYPGHKLAFEIYQLLDNGYKGKFENDYNNSNI